VSLLAATVGTFIWGAAQTVTLIGRFIATPADTALIVPIVQLMDEFLLGTVLLIFALGLYELFIEKLALPEWLVIDSLKKLKGKLSDVVVLLFAIKFLEKFIDSKNAQDTLLMGIAAFVAMGGLILFNFAAARSGD
jgi:uncharacterized membrane protein YqhA